MSDDKGKLPSIKDQTNTGEISQELKDYLVDLQAKVEQDDDDRQSWKTKCIIAQNQRLGVKRYSKFPYPGAPNFPLPETDKLIKKQVPNLVLSAWAPKKMCLVQVKAGYAPNKEWDAKARKSEAAINCLLRSDDLDWFNKLYIAADYAKEKGHCLFRVREEFKSRWVTKVFTLSDYDSETIKALKGLPKDGLRQFIADQFMLDVESEDDLKAIDSAIDQFKSGDEIIELVYEDIDSFPQVDVPLPTKVIVPSYTTDIAQAQRIAYEFFLMRHELERLIDKGIYREKDLDSMSFETIDDDIVEVHKEHNEGVTSNKSKGELYRIREISSWYKEDDRWHRRIFVTLADAPEEENLLADIAFPFEFDGWNWVKYDNETKDPRYYSSRGLPEQIRAYQEIMEMGLNNMLIRDQMNNTPMYQVLSSSQILTSHIPFTPGAKLPVKTLGGEIAPLGGNSPDVSSMNIMQIIKGSVEEYQSSNDYLFRNATNSGGGKTLGEINVGMQHNSKPLSMEVAAWNNSLSKVYRMMFDIMKERMGESMWLPDGTEVTRDDFNFPAEIRSNGDIELSNAQLQSQKAMARLQILFRPEAQEFTTPEDRYNTIKDWLEKEGAKDPEQFITDPMEVMQDKGVQMQQQLQQMGQQLQQMQKQGEDMQKNLMKKEKDAKDAENEAKAMDEMTNQVVEEMYQPPNQGAASGQTPASY